MVNQDTLEGRWRQISGRLREKWGELTQDELDQAHGSAEELIGYLQRKTGESREAIENYLNESTGGSGISAYLHDAREAVNEYASEAAAMAGGAAATVQHKAEDVNEAIHEGYHQAEELVKQRPAESIAVAFGAGLVVGVVLGLIVSSK